jgi:polyhydroxyalkanoate synthesis regulator protein
MEPIIIKRYARSRLSDPAKRRYVTMEQLLLWTAKGVAFVVQDSETGADRMLVRRLSGEADFAQRIVWLEDVSG